MINKDLLSATLKVALVTPNFFPRIGGIEEHVRELASYLSKNKNIEVSVFTSVRYDSDLPDTSTSDQGFKIVRTRSRSVFFWIPHIPKEFTIIHLHNFSIFPHILLIFLHRRTKKIFLTPHGGACFNHNNYRFPLNVIKFFYTKTLGGWAYKQAKGVILLNGKEKDVLDRSRLINSSTRIISNGLSDVFFNNAVVNKTKNYKYFLTVGRIHKLKGLDQVVRIMREFPSYKYCIIGPDDGDLARLRSISKRCGVADRVLFLGPKFNEEKLEWIKGSSLYISPSLSESQGISVLEAVALGKIVVASNVYGHMSLAKDFKTIYLYDLDRGKKELIHKINKALNISCKDVNLVKEKCKEMYSWQKIVKQVVTFYEEA